MRTNTNIVAIGDLHLSTWIRNSPEKNYRMKVQPIKLAERINEVMKTYDTDYLFILGDLINDWDENPQVIDVLRTFYQTIIDANPDCYIGYILGQHDMMIYDRYEKDNSYVHLVGDLFKQVHYLHDTTLNINDTSIYLSSYNREGPLYPPEHVNVFLSHISFGFVEVNESLFDLCVAGDIHALWDVGKCHSTCPPYQLHPSQEQNGYISVIGLNKAMSTFKRIPSDSVNFSFLKFDPVQKRYKKEEEQQKNTELRLSESDIMKMITDEVNKNGIAAVHNKLDLSGLPTPVSFKFQLKNLIIDNVRSIEHLALKLDELSGINYVKGATGSGKSTIFYSIITAFVGASKEELVNKTNTFTKKPLRIQLDLEYEGKEYHIERSVKETILVINGERYNVGKRETEKKIKECLPFTEYYRYFYLRANKHYFESIDKTELMNVLFNLKIFDYLYSESATMIKSLNREIKAKNESLIRSQTMLEDQTTRLTEAQTKLQEFNDVASVNKEQLLADVRTIQNTERQIESYNTVINSKTALIEKYEQQQQNVQLPDLDLLNERKKTLVVDLNNTKERNNYYQSRKRELAKFEGQLEILNSAKVVTCPNCGAILKGKDEEQIRNLTNKITEYKEQLACIGGEIDISKLLNELNDIDNQIRNANNILSQKSEILKLKEAILEAKQQKDTLSLELQKLLVKYNAEDTHSFMVASSELVSRITTRENIQTEVDKLERQRVESQNQVEQCQSELKNVTENLALTEKYNRLFDVENLSSIPYSILDKLVHYLNTENIKFESAKSEDKFGINAYIKVADEWISYDEASDGQKNYLDMFILIRISSFLGGVGCIILDEPVVNMDAEYVALADGLLSDITADTIFVSSHYPLTGYDRLITVERKNNRLTSVEIH